MRWKWILIAETVGPPAPPPDTMPPAFAAAAAAPTGLPAGFGDATGGLPAPPPTAPPPPPLRRELPPCGPVHVRGRSHSNHGGAAWRCHHTCSPEATRKNRDTAPF